MEHSWKCMCILSKTFQVYILWTCTLKFGINDLRRQKWNITTIVSHIIYCCINISDSGFCCYYLRMTPLHLKKSRCVPCCTALFVQNRQLNSDPRLDPLCFCKNHSVGCNLQPYHQMPLTVNTGPVKMRVSSGILTSFLLSAVVMAETSTKNDSVFYHRQCWHFPKGPERCLWLPVTWLQTQLQQAGTIVLEYTRLVSVQLKCSL